MKRLFKVNLNLNYVLREDVSIKRKSLRTVFVGFRNLYTGKKRKNQRNDRLTHSPFGLGTLGLRTVHGLQGNVFSLFQFF